MLLAALTYFVETEGNKGGQNVFHDICVSWIFMVCILTGVNNPKPRRSL